MEALSKNEEYLTKTLKIGLENLYHSHIIRFNNVKDVILDKIFIEKQIIPNIKLKNNGKLPPNFDDKINKNKNKLYKDFFNNLFLNSDNIFKIEKYHGYYESS